MGRSKDNQKFLLKHPVCCLCGGEIAATTVEHAPALALFVDRNVKGLFRFPACERCNGGSSELDQVAALFTLTMGGATASHVRQAYLEKLLQGVANNYPEVINLVAQDSEAKQLRINGLIRQVHLVEVDRRLFRDWLDPWAVKQALSFWYQHTGKVLPETGGIFVHWVTNAHIDGHKEFLGNMSKLGLNLETVRQGKLSYQEQFTYRFALSEDNSFGTFIFAYHDSCLAWCGVFESRSEIDRFNSLPIYKTGKVNGIEAFSYPLPK